MGMAMRLGRHQVVLLAIVVATLGLRSCHLGNQLGSPLAHPERFLVVAQNSIRVGFRRCLPDGNRVLPSHGAQDLLGGLKTRSVLIYQMHRGHDLVFVPHWMKF